MLLMTRASEWKGVFSTTQARVMGSSQAHHVLYLSIPQQSEEGLGVSDACMADLDACVPDTTDHTHFFHKGTVNAPFIHPLLLFIQLWPH